MTSPGDECREALESLLLAATAEAAGPHAAHIDQCSRCAAELASLRPVADELRKALRPADLDPAALGRILGGARSRGVGRVMRLAPGAAWAAAACLAMSLLPGATPRTAARGAIDEIVADEQAAQEVLVAFGMSFVNDSVDVVLERADQALSRLEGMVQDAGSALPWPADDKWDVPDGPRDGPARSDRRPAAAGALATGRGVRNGRFPCFETVQTLAGV